MSGRTRPSVYRPELVPCSYCAPFSFTLFISFTPIGLLQAVNVNLGHLQHGFEDSLRFYRVFVLHQFEQRLRDDLPRYAKFVFQPCALHFSSASRELLPHLIHFGLRLAVYKERYGWRKSVVWATVQCHEFLSFELESHRHHGSFRARTRFSVTGNVQDFRALENRGIKVCCLFRFAVEPQEW